MNRIGIRWRIAIWNTAAFASVLLVFGVLVYALLRQTHYDQVDAWLLARYEQVMSDSAVIGDPQQGFPLWVNKFGKHVEIFGAVLDPDGEVIAQAESLEGISVPDVATGAPEGPTFDSISLPGLGHARRMRSQIQTGEGPYTLLLLAEMEHVDEELAEVIKVLLLTIPVAMVIAAALSYWLASKALSPVEDLSRMSDEITADRLDRRLPVPNHNDELGHLARTINTMIGRLENSFAEVRRFTGDASHQLRTPVAIIRSEAEMGMDGAVDVNEARKRFESILEECGRLTSMTSQLLTLSRNDAQAKRSVQESVELEPLLREVAEAMRPQAAAKQQHLTIQLDDTATVLSDSERLREVFHNLVDNAIKYTPEGGAIQLRLSGNNAEAIIEVRDNGIGISDESAPFVFDRFYRGNRTSKPGNEGAGLGLSIVKSILDSIGGKVDFASSDAGSVFRVSLPKSISR